jgi:glycosyltransferase involved in cell wall biosynthesis
MKPNSSIVLTVHNKDFLLEESLNRIKKFTSSPYELILVIDGCTDGSLKIAENFKKKNHKLKILIEETPDIFETKANNVGCKLSSGDYIFIVQDDMLINENGWNLRLLKPFNKFTDVFAVSANCSHNWIYNPNSKHVNLNENLNSSWCDILSHVDHAGRVWNLPRNVFAVRQCVNRGPLVINHDDLVKLNYFDEIFYPLDMDDHDLCFRMKKDIGKVVGCYWIDFISKFNWGGTHNDDGTHKSWFYESNHKNMKIVWNRHKDLITTTRIVENRILK